MSRAKSHWRQLPPSDDFAELESNGGYEYGSSEDQSLSPSFYGKEHNSKSKMPRKVSTSTKSRRSSTADAEFEEDDQWDGGSDEDSKKRGRKKADTADKLIVSQKFNEFLRDAATDKRGIETSRPKSRFSTSLPPKERAAYKRARSQS
jgi:hypothetical protein